MYLFLSKGCIVLHSLVVIHFYLFILSTDIYNHLQLFTITSNAVTKVLFKTCWENCIL